MDRRHIDLPGVTMEPTHDTPEHCPDTPPLLWWPGVQEDLIKAIARRTNTPIVVVLVNGGPLDVSWAATSDRVGAMVAAWYPGQAGATGNEHRSALQVYAHSLVHTHTLAGVVDVLLGGYNPTGKLPVTFYYENYTSQIAMTDMNMRVFPGRTHRYLQVQ